MTARLCIALIGLLLASSSGFAEHADSLPSISGNSAAVPLSPREIEHRVLDINPGESVSLHRLNYAIAGTNDAKLQFGFKFRLSESVPLYFAYSNLAVWDIYETSSPFDDINFIHTSNGNEGELSRSQDRLALRVNKVFTPGPMHLVWITSLYAPLTTGEENENIDHYLGYWDMYLVLRGLFGAERENLDLEFFTQGGRDNIPFNRGNLSVGLKYRLPTAAFNPYLYAQYFYGYGETLLNYDQRDNQFRAGLAFFY